MASVIRGDDNFDSQLKTVNGTSLIGSGNIEAGASTSYGTVGSYVFGDMQTAYIIENSTYSGSSIQPAGISISTYSSNYDVGNDDGSWTAYHVKGGSTLSGTWRAMGRSRNASTYSRNKSTLFVRIS